MTYEDAYRTLRVQYDRMTLRTFRLRQQAWVKLFPLLAPGVVGLKEPWPKKWSKR